MGSGGRHLLSVGVEMEASLGGSERVVSLIKVVLPNLVFSLPGFRSLLMAGPVVTKCIMQKTNQIRKLLVSHFRCVCCVLYQSQKLQT